MRFFMSHAFGPTHIGSNSQLGRLILRFFVATDRRVPPEWPPMTAKGAKMKPQRRQMEPNDAPEAPPWTCKGDKWSPNGRPKALKAAQGYTKTTEDMPKEPNET